MIKCCILENGSLQVITPAEGEVTLRENYDESKPKVTSTSTRETEVEKKYIINNLKYSDGSPDKKDTLDYESTNTQGNHTYKMGRQSKRDAAKGIYPKN